MDATSTDKVTPTTTSTTSPSTLRTKAINPLAPFKPVPVPAPGPALSGLGSESAADSPAALPQPLDTTTTTAATPPSSTSPSTASSTAAENSSMKPASRHMTRSASSEKDLSLKSTSVAGVAPLDDINSSNDMEVDATSESNLSDGDPPGYVDQSGEGSVPMKKRQSSASGGLPKRNFEELEEITFASPRSFQTMAFAIAATRGVDLQVTDDRTHKVTSAYMHITCSYRRSGCPFILKLTKAKEGGWVLKSSRATDVDPKQRSVYRCRHSAGATPDSPVSNARSALASPGDTPFVEIPVLPSVGTGTGTGTGTGPVTGTPSGTTTSHPGPSGTKPKAVRKRIKKDKHAEDESLFGKAPTARLAGFRTGGAKTNNNSSTAPSSYLPSPDEAPRLHYLDDVGDRALAPPFERSNMLQSQISPALTAPHQQYANLPPLPGSSRSTYDADWGPSTSNNRRSSANGNANGNLPPPSALYPPGSTYTSALSGFSHSAFAPSSQSSSRLPLTPLLAPPVPTNSLSQWTAFLTMLDKELTFLAPVLSSPGLSVTLSSFFHETDSSEEMRVSLIESLSDQDCPRWPRIKLMKLVKEKGLEVWEKVKEIEELGFDLMDGVVFEKDGGGGENEAVKKRREKQKELERRDERPGPEEMRVDVKAFDGINGKPATTALLVGNASTKTDPSASNPPTPPSTSSNNPTTSKLALAKGLSSHYGSTVPPPTSSSGTSTTLVEAQPPPPSSTLANVKQKIKPIAPANPPTLPTPTPTQAQTNVPTPSSPLSVATGMTHVISRTTVPSPGSAIHQAWRDVSMNSPLGFSSGPTSPRLNPPTVGPSSSSTDKGKGKANTSPYNNYWSFNGSSMSSGERRPNPTSPHLASSPPPLAQRTLGGAKPSSPEVMMSEVKKEDTSNSTSIASLVGTGKSASPPPSRPSPGPVPGPLLSTNSSSSYSPWPMSTGLTLQQISMMKSSKSSRLTSTSNSTASNPVAVAVGATPKSHTLPQVQTHSHSPTPSASPSPFNLPASSSSFSSTTTTGRTGVSHASGSGSGSGSGSRVDLPPELQPLARLYAFGNSSRNGGRGGGEGGMGGQSRLSSSTNTPQAGSSGGGMGGQGAAGTK